MTFGLGNRCSIRLSYASGVTHGSETFWGSKSRNLHPSEMEGSGRVSSISLMNSGKIAHHVSDVGESRGWSAEINSNLTSLHEK